MKAVTILLSSALALAGFMLLPMQAVVATADAATSDEILRAADARAARFPDQTYTASMAIYRGGELRSTIVFTMAMKNLEKQLIRFVEPGDVAGMTILMESRETIYMYSPEFKKVRRIAAHMQNQGFLGSEFTPEDMILARLSPSFDAALVGKTGSETSLTLTPRAGAVVSFAKLEIFIDSTVGGITRIHYYDAAGRHVRTQSREAWKRFEDAQIPTQIRMTNLVTGDETIIRLSNIDVTTPVSDDLFSRRALLSG